MAKVIVTGASGMIGSHLVDELVKQGHVVFGLDRYSAWSNPKAHYCYFDLRDSQRASSEIELIAPEIVIHCAANAAQGKGQMSPIDMTSNNYNTFFNVLTPAIRSGKLKRFLFTSTIGVYGNINTPFRETDIPIPVDIYSIAKRAIEQSLQVMAKVHKFEYVIFRLHNVTGERQNINDPYRNVVTLFMTHLLRGVPYSIFGNGEVARQFSYVKDVTNVIAKAVDYDVANTIFNVGADRMVPLKELSNIIQQISGIKIEPIFKPLRSQEVFATEEDHTLARNIFGYADTPLEDYLVRVWDYVKSFGVMPINYEKLELEAL